MLLMKFNLFPKNSQTLTDTRSGSARFFSSPCFIISFDLCCYSFTISRCQLNFYVAAASKHYTFRVYFIHVKCQCSMRPTRWTERADSENKQRLTESPHYGGFVCVSWMDARFACCADAHKLFNWHRCNWEESLRKPMYGIFIADEQCQRCRVIVSRNNRE